MKSGTISHAVRAQSSRAQVHVRIHLIQKYQLANYLGPLVSSHPRVLQERPIEHYVTS
jgi:hypothetical protein